MLGPRCEGTSTSTGASTSCSGRYPESVDVCELTATMRPSVASTTTPLGSVSSNSTKRSRQPVCVQRSGLLVQHGARTSRTDASMPLTLLTSAPCGYMGSFSLPRKPSCAPSVRVGPCVFSRTAVSCRGRPRGTTTSGHKAWWLICVATEPNSVRLSTLRPRDPTTKNALCRRRRRGCPSPRLARARSGSRALRRCRVATASRTI